MLSDQNQNLRKMIIALALCLSLGGILFRLNHITQNDFIFFDEGYYLNHNRIFAQLITDHYPKNFADLWRAFYTYIRFSLATGKALWFATVDFRIFLGGMQAWFFPRVVASLMGIATFALIYRFARRYYDSPMVGWLSMAFLAVLPSHVFYSRVGLQETFCTFLLLAGFYFYVFPKRFGWRTFASGILLAAAFFANYRMIILPIYVVVTELWMTLTAKDAAGINWAASFRKLLWFMLTFLSCVFFIGNIDDAQNTVTTFAWMFHQASLAESKFEMINFLSYPYYLFRLDNFVFGILFFGNVYLFFRKEWKQLLPFVLVVLQMLLFSLAYEKGARYLCVMFPFMVMSVAYLLLLLWEKMNRKLFRQLLWIGVIIMLGFMIRKSFMLAQTRSDYRSSTEYLTSMDPDVKFLSTQPWVQNLFVPVKQNVQPCPHRIEYLVQYHNKGYRYLVVCPQAYVTWTDDQRRFSTPLEGYLMFVTRRFQPIKTFPHFNEAVLERFVFDHNENLFQSIRFLREAKGKGYGALKIYDIGQIVSVTMKLFEQKGMKYYERGELPEKNVRHLKF